MLDGAIENSFDSRIQTRKDAYCSTPIQVKFRENIYQSFFAARVENKGKHARGTPLNIQSPAGSFYRSLLSVGWLAAGCIYFLNPPLFFLTLGLHEEHESTFLNS
jgi:hypothetical protein